MILRDNIAVLGLLWGMLRIERQKVLSLEFATRQSSTVFVLMDVSADFHCNVVLKEGFAKATLQEVILVCLVQLQLNEFKEELI